MIDVERVSVTLGGHPILERVSLAAAAGELVAIAGSNGAGKSTLLRTMTGDQRPHAGVVSIAGVAVERSSAARLARVRAFVPQSSHIDFAFTALEVTLLGRTPYVCRRESRHDLDVAAWALDAAGVGHLADRSYPTLSGGERQRVQLARALAQIWDAPEHRRVLLLDEPTASLDLTHQHRVLALARTLADRGTCVCVVLHDVNLAARYADRVVLLRRGRIVANGSPADVLTPERLADTFGVRALVIDHPAHDCPLVVTVEPHPRNSSWRH